MRIYTANYIKRPRKAFWSVCVAFLLLASLLFDFVPQRALASNAYFDNVVFYKNIDGYNHLSFHTKTTFIWTNNSDFGRIFKNGVLVTGLSPCGSPVTYTAGQNYDFKIYGSRYCGAPDNGVYTSEHYVTKIGDAFAPNPFTPNFTDQGPYYFTEYPTLTITYPANNAEIAGNFYITGSFTQPTTPTYAHWLQAIATPAGVLSEYPNAFYWPTNDATSSPFEIWISSLSAGYYDFYIYMKDIVGDFYPAGVSNWKLTNIHIVNDLPFSLPPYAEQPPYTAPPIFETLNPITYYTANSGYATSTALYTTFTDILAPVLLTLGQNLLAYSSNFTPSNASSTGNQIGESVVLIRSYLSNINSFFNNFPVSQFLVLYLIVLLLVVVMRLIKGLIHLFKPV